MAAPILNRQQQAAFYPEVWQTVRQVPPGHVATYGQIAALVSPPPGFTFEDYKAWGARWVGQAMAACPEDVPWQRVVNGEGKISPRPGAELQQRLLEQEGVSFDGHGRIDLKRFGWNTDYDQETGWQQESLF